MKRPIVQSSVGVTLLGGGAVESDCLAEALALAPCLVAADGGADAALAAGRMPEAVIGDFDSIGPAARAAIPAARQFPIAEQDSTDFGKCLAHVAAPFLIAVGFAGPRLDHVLAVWSALAAAPGQRCLVLGPEDVAFLCPAALDLPLAPGTRVSLWPLGAVRGESRGLRWPIGGIDFAPAGRIGTSNTAEGPVSLRIAGPMLAILPRDCLRPALAALAPG